MNNVRFNEFVYRLNIDWGLSIVFPWCHLQLSLVVFSAEDLSNNVCAEDTFKTNLSKTSIEIFVRWLSLRQRLFGVLRDWKKSCTCRIEASFGQVEVCDDKCDSPDTGVLTGAGRVLCCPAPDTMDRGGNAEFNASLPVQILPGAGETKPTECPQGEF